MKAGTHARFALLLAPLFAGACPMKPLVGENLPPPDGSTTNVERAALLEVEPETSGQGFADTALGAGSSLFYLVSNRGNLRTGSVDLSIIGADAGEFAVARAGCTAPLDQGLRCRVEVTFAPKTPGTKQATLFARASPGGEDAILLSGLGTGPLVTAEPRALDFGMVRLRGRAATRSIKLINAGNRSSGALDLSIPAPFTATGTNCTELVAGANCELTVIFNPVAVGPTSGQLVVNGKNLGASPSVAVSGVGVPVLSLTVTPSPLILPDVLVGGTAEGQFTISTAGGAATFEAAVPSFVGRDAHEFSVVSSQCGEPLPANRGCTVNVRFSPKAAGTKQVVFVVHTEDQLGSAPLQASASGQILRPVFITPRRGDFPPTQVPSNGSSVTFTVQNLTGTDAKLAAAIEGPDAGLFSIGATTCPPMLTPGLACMVPVHFLPRQVGMFSASLAASMLSPGGSATDSVILVGQGVAPPPMAGFFVLPANATLRVMEPLAFRAVRVSPAGATQDLTTTAIWTSSNAPVATITAGGVAVGVSPGLAIITASATVDGVLLLARANLTVVR